MTNPAATRITKTVNDVNGSSTSTTPTAAAARPSTAITHQGTRTRTTSPPASPGTAGYVWARMKAAISSIAVTDSIGSSPESTHRMPSSG